jgi:hypothetical protein
VRLFLKFDGELRGKGRRKASRNTLRKHFHEQLKTFWTNTSVLKDWETNGEYFGQKYSAPMRLAESCAKEFQLERIAFVPLVSKGMKLKCSLDILMLVAHQNSGVFYGGDIDNRTKSLIDGLRKPQQSNEINDELQEFSPSNPLFTLLEDDNLIDELKIRYGTLNDLPEDHKEHHVFALIEANVTPSFVTIDNSAFL